MPRDSRRVPVSRRVLDFLQPGQTASVCVLARAVYDVETPSRSQLAAVRRAALKLSDWGLLEAVGRLPDQLPTGHHVRHRGGVAVRARNPAGIVYRRSDRFDSSPTERFGYLTPNRAYNAELKRRTRMLETATAAFLRRMEACDNPGLQRYAEGEAYPIVWLAWSVVIGPETYHLTVGGRWIEEGSSGGRPVIECDLEDVARSLDMILKSRERLP